MTDSLTAIRAMLTEMEPAEPQTAIVTYLAAHEGKKLTARDEKAMKATIDPSIHFADFDPRFGRFALPKIEWGGYGAHGGSNGGCLYLQSSPDAPMMDGSPDRRVACAKATIENNPSKFRAREERNAQRVAALADQGTLIDAANAIDAINKAHATLKALCEHGEPLSVIGYQIEDLVSCKNGRGSR